MQVKALSEERAGRRQPVKRESLLDLIGDTPLVRLNRITADLPSSVEVWAKLELMNPGQSVKDRTARQIIEDALARGDLDLDGGRRLIDATGGATGVAYAMLGAALDVGVTLVMPENFGAMYRRLIEAFDAEIVTSSTEAGRDGAIALATQMAESRPDELWYADQYNNPSNPRAHELTTAREIWAQTQGRVTHLVNSMGTSGTLMGTHRGLAAKNPNLVTIGCQPKGATHAIEGVTQLPSSIKPGIYVPNALSGIVECETTDAWAMAARLAAEEGIPGGYSSGANVWAALEVAKSLSEGVVVTIVTDHADRYLEP